MSCSIGCADQELSNLQRSKYFFEAERHFDRESRESVVCVLVVKLASLPSLYTDHRGFTIKECSPELINTNNHIGGAIYLMPAHMHNIAPAW